MDEKRILEAINQIVTQFGFPIPLNTVHDWCGIPTRRFVRAMRVLRAGGDVKVTDGMVTFAINAYLYQPAMKPAERN